MSSIMRIGGLATGMDTDSMVKQLMDAERVRLNKFNQNKQIKLWTQELYNNTNKDIANFILDTKKELELSKTTSGGYLLQNSVSNLSWVKKATSSDANIFTTTSTADAPTGTHTIKIKQLAEGVSVASQDAIAAPNDTLSELGVGDGSIEFEISGGKKVTVSYKSTDTLSTLAKSINDAVVSSSDSTPLGLKASYDSGSKRFFLSTKSTGSSAQIKITNDANNLFVGANSKLETNMTADPTMYKGKDAIIDFDGAQNIIKSSNQFTINGINVDLKSVPAGTDSDHPYVGTIKVDTDVDGVYNKIKGFIDKYNELLDKLNTKTSEKKYRDYQPLTDEQKKAMDEDTIKLWESKAKSGLLRNDASIENMLSNARSGLYDTVYSDYHSNNTANEVKISGYSVLTEIGITTGTYQEKGKLKIDESKLKAAITDNPDGVMNLLFKTSDITESQINSMPTTTNEERAAKEAKIKEMRKESGIITRIYDDLVGGMKDIISRSGTGENSTLYKSVRSNILVDFVVGKNLTGTGSISLIDKDVFDIEKRISSENDRLTRKENSYYRKFAALEKSMSKMNSQSSWLSSQLGAMR